MHYFTIALFCRCGGGALWAVSQYGRYEKSSAKYVFRPPLPPGWPQMTKYGFRMGWMRIRACLRPSNVSDTCEITFLRCDHVPDERAQVPGLDLIGYSPPPFPLACPGFLRGLYMHPICALSSRESNQKCEESSGTATRRKQKI